MFINVRLTLSMLGKIFSRWHLEIFLFFHHEQIDGNFFHMQDFISSIPNFLQWTFPSLNLDKSIVANKDIGQKSISKKQTV